MKRLEGIGSFFRRNNITIGITIIALAFMTILYLQAIATSQLQAEVTSQQQIIQQIKGIADQIRESGEQRTQQIDKLNRHMDCIVEFFSLPPASRTQTAIANINNCELKEIPPPSPVPSPTTSPRPAPTTASRSTPAPTSTPASSPPQVARLVPDGHVSFFSQVVQRIKRLLNLP